MAHRDRKTSSAWLGVFTAGLLASGSVVLSSPAHAAESVTTPDPAPALSTTSTPAPAPAAGPESAPATAAATALGAFLESGPVGVGRIAQLERWLGGRELRVGHTYLPGDLWSNIESPLDSWTPGRTGATSARTGCSS